MNTLTRLPLLILLCSCAKPVDAAPRQRPATIGDAVPAPALDLSTMPALPVLSEPPPNLDQEVKDYMAVLANIFDVIAAREAPVTKPLTTPSKENR